MLTGTDYQDPLFFAITRNVGHFKISPDQSINQTDCGVRVKPSPLAVTRIGITQASLSRRSTVFAAIYHVSFAYQTEISGPYHAGYSSRHEKSIGPTTCEA